MRIRTLNVCPQQRQVEAHASEEERRKPPHGVHIHALNQLRPHGRHCWRRRRLCQALTAVVVVVVLSLFQRVAGVEFETITFSEWSTLFDAASAALQLPQLYLSGPRVRAKLLVGSRITMTDLLNGEAILRQRISEIVDVAFERVLVEYIETTALTESVSGTWALSIGISALVPPAPTATSPNTTLVASTVDAERRRILHRLLFGGIVRGSNVTIDSLQLFGSPMQLLTAHLDGESFFQIDTKPWVGVIFVIASGGATTSAVAVGTETSFSAAFQNLRLRFVLAKTLQRLKVDTTSILVRDVIPLEATQLYGVPASLVPVEIHIGDNSYMRSAIDGYFRNTSFATALRDIAPQWTLLAIDVDEDADSLKGSNGPSMAAVSQYLNEVQDVLGRVAIEIRVDSIGLPHVQRRAAAILDATRSLLSRFLDLSSVGLSFGQLSMLPGTSTSTASDSTTLTRSEFFVSSGSDDMGRAPQPLDRPFVVRIHLTPVNGAAVSIDQVQFGIVSTLSTADARVTFGFLDPSELASSSYQTSRVQYLQTTATESTTLGSSFVRVVLTLVPHANDTIDTIDAFELYAIRCALVLVLERVLFGDQDLVLVENSPLQDLRLELGYIVQVSDENQRNGIARAVNSWRLQQAIADTTAFALVARQVDLYADGSMPHSLILPGSSSHLGFDAFSTTTPTGVLDPAETVYRYTDPWPTLTSSVLSAVPPTCPDPLVNPSPASRFYGCLVLHWSSGFAMHTVFLQSLSVPRGVELNSTNLLIPAATQPTPPVQDTAAPWVPTISSNEPSDWALQFRSAITQNAMVNLTFAFDNSSATVYPSFTLSAMLQLTDMQAPASMRVLSLARGPSMVIPPSPALERLPSVFATAAITDTSSVFSSSVSLALSPRTALGLMDEVSAIATWSANQASCLACLPSIDACESLNECRVIAQCFQQTLDQRLSLYSELLEQSSGSFDLSDSLATCVSPRDVPWSQRGRRAYTSALKCVLQASCPIATSPALGRRLSLQYVPRAQTVRVVSSHFPLSLAFLLDIHGGLGASPDGATRSKSSSLITEMTPPTLFDLRALVLDLYGDVARGLDVVTTLSTDPVSGAMEIRIQYWFLDTGVAGLPFVSVITDSTADPAPDVETTSSESLAVVSEAS